MSDSPEVKCIICYDNCELVALDNDSNPISLFSDLCNQYFPRRSRVNYNLTPTIRRIMCCQPCNDLLQQIYELNEILKQVEWQVKDLVDLCMSKGQEKGEEEDDVDLANLALIKDEPISEEEEDAAFLSSQEVYLDKDDEITQKEQNSGEEGETSDSEIIKRTRRRTTTKSGRRIIYVEEDSSSSSTDSSVGEGSSRSNNLRRKKRAISSSSSSSSSSSCSSCSCSSCSCSSCSCSPCSRNNSPVQPSMNLRAEGERSDYLSEDDKSTRVKEPIYCKFCREEFPTTAARYRHQRICKSGGFSCSVCSKIFSGLKRCYVHQVRSCGVDTFSKDELQKVGIVFCDFEDCNFMVASKSNMERHARTHTREKSWLCSKCGSAFAEKYGLDQHSRQPTDCGIRLSTRLQEFQDISVPKPFPCPRSGCGFSFNSDERLSQHIVKIHESNGEEDLVDCGICGRSLKKHSLLEHIKRVHERKKQHTCTECDKRFHSLRELQMHGLRMHTSVKGSLQCEQCNKTFSTATDLKKHMIRIHGNGERNFVCESCGFAFKTNAELVRHTRRKHKNDSSENTKVRKKRRTGTSSTLEDTGLQEGMVEVDGVFQEIMGLVQ